jgi:hypothetical protein
VTFIPRGRSEGPSLQPPSTSSVHQSARRMLSRPWQRANLDHVATAFVVFAVWLYVIVRTYPSTTSDRGIFVSVAERILAGDRLYVDVYDNKEPLFYYMVALQRAVGFHAEWLFELALVVSCSLLCHRIFSALRLHTAGPVAAIAVPMVLVGAYYVPGYTHLPGILLSLAAILLAVQGRAAAAGFVVAMTFMTKIVLGPVAAVACFVIVMMSRSRAALVGRAIIGGLAGLSAVGLLLLMRGEFHGFIDVLMENIVYSQSVATADGVLSRLRSAEFGQLTTIAMISMFVAFAASRKLRGGDGRYVGALCATGLVAGAVLLATAIWPHHWQALYLPLVLLCGCLGVVLRGTVGYRRSVCLAAVGVLIGGGFPLYRLGVDPGLRAPMSAETLLLLEHQDSVRTYARLGQNDERGHARGLRSWSLACPRFHVYSFQSAEVWEETARCALDAPVLILGWTFSTGGWWQSAEWDRFVTSTEVEIARLFDCREKNGVRVCTRRSGASMD